MAYFKSLFPYRWILLFVFICCFQLWGWYASDIISYLPFTVMNVLTWFILDYTIGIGRTEGNFIKNLIGVAWLTMVVSIVTRIYIETNHLLTL